MGPAKARMANSTGTVFQLMDYDPKRTKHEFQLFPVLKSEIKFKKTSSVVNQYYILLVEFSSCNWVYTYLRTKIHIAIYFFF